MAISKLPVEVAARHAIWRALGWEELPDSKVGSIWDRFEQSFGFFGTGIQEPTPSHGWDITWVFEREQAFLDYLAADLNCKVLCALQRCIGVGERLYALDWMHPCFWFDPRGVVQSGDPDEWAVPVL